MTPWDAFLDRPAEDTQFTESAHAYARAKALERFAEPRFATDGTELRILPSPEAGYVAVVLGQAASQSGMQGCSPERITYLRDEVELPVWLTFIQGGKERVTVWSCWTHLIGPAKPIALDPALKRFGWPCKDLNPVHDLRFPEAVPPTPALPAGLF